MKYAIHVIDRKTDVRYMTFVSVKPSENLLPFRHHLECHVLTSVNLHGAKKLRLVRIYVDHLSHGRGYDIRETGDRSYFYS
jgi:hypothetical protein